MDIEVYISINFSNGPGDIDRKRVNDIINYR
jgi:hypothetical protein